MALALTINRNEAPALYLQIAQQVRGQIREGRLPVGSQLPPIRQLAASLGVTRPTVESAYDELRAGGWVETVVGRGTFVAKTADPRDIIDTLGMNITANGVLVDMPRLDEIPLMCSLAYAEPDPELFPMDEFWAPVNSLRLVGADVIRYGQPQGDPGLRIELVKLLRERGLEAVPEDVIVTSGASQGIALVTQALTQRGDYVVVEDPTHICLLNCIKSRGLNPIAVPIQPDGPDLYALERIFVQYNPRVFFTVPNYQNPTGYVMSYEKRVALLEMAMRHGVVIVEDDVYGQVSYEDNPPPSLKSLDERDMVVYLTSVSKTMMNGIRLGWMVAPRELHDHLLRLKRSSDVCTSPLMQRMILPFLRSGRLKAHLKRVVPIYRERRDNVLRALQNYMPTGVRWTEPEGGMVVWVTLPDGLDVHTLHRQMLRKGFAFTPGTAFFAHPTDTTHFRICFASHPAHVVTEAVQVLARLIEQELRAGTPPTYPDPLV
jgi:2-aminoadipate transaminase